MTIRIAQDLPVVLGNQDSAEEPAGDAFALALRSRMRRDDQAAAPGEPARPARGKKAGNHGADHPERPGQREKVGSSPQVEHRDAGRGPVTALGRGASRAGDSSSLRADDVTMSAPGGASPEAPAADAGVVESTLTEVQVSSQVVAPSVSGAPPLATPIEPGSLSGSTPAHILAAVSAAQGEAASLASAQLTATAQLQQAAMGQALVDPADAAGRDPLPSAFVTPTIVPSVEPPIVPPAEPAVLLPAAASAAEDAGALSVPASATTAAPVAGAGVSAGPAAVAVASGAATTTIGAVTPGSAPVAYGGAAMAGGRPYLTSSAPFGADGTARLGDVLGVSGPLASVAPNSIGAAAGQTLSVSTESGADGTPSGAAPAGAATAPVGLTPGGVAQPSADDALAETVAVAAVRALAPPIGTASADAGSAGRAPGPFTVDLADSATEEASLSVPEPAPVTTTSSTAPAAGARHADPPPASTPPPAPVTSSAAAPSAAPHHAAPAAQPAGPPPAVHSQILSAMTPTLQRRDGSYSVELQLDPASLGRVRVQVAIAGGEVSLHLASGDAGTRDLLRQHAEQLRQQLAESGFNRSSVDVGGGSRNSGQDASQQQAYGPSGSHGDVPGRGGSGGGGQRGAPGSAEQPAGHDPRLLQQDISEAVADARRGDGPLDVRV